MELCDRCGGEFEELFVQLNGERWCRNCHLGLNSDFTDEEYNRLRIEYDKDADFKGLRHRFWALGVNRRHEVLRLMGYFGQGETLMEKIERFKLYKIKENGAEAVLKGLIEAQEAIILAENEKSDYIQPKDIPGPVSSSGRVHSGRVKLTVGPTNPGSQWEDK